MKLKWMQRVGRIVLLCASENLVRSSIWCVRMVEQAIGSLREAVGGIQAGHGVTKAVCEHRQTHSVGRY